MSISHQVWMSQKSRGSVGLFMIIQISRIKGPMRRREDAADGISQDCRLVIAVKLQVRWAEYSRILLGCLEKVQQYFNIPCVKLQGHLG